MKSTLITTLDKAKLIGPAFAVYDRLLAVRLRLAGRDPATMDDLPVPPPYLRALVGGTPDLGAFISAGRMAAEAVSDALEAAGLSIDGLETVLDFGCGCGRVAR